MDYNNTTPKNIHYLKLDVASDRLINIRICVGDDVTITQCRNNARLMVPIDLSVLPRVTIENLTPNTALWFNKIYMNFVDITDISFDFFKTYQKDNMNEIGGFVPDIYSPDIVEIKFEKGFYYKIMDHFVRYNLLQPQ